MKNRQIFFVYTVLHFIVIFEKTKIQDVSLNYDCVYILFVVRDEYHISKFSESEGIGYRQ